jgi:uncharacterized protein (TIGR03435 family)
MRSSKCTATPWHSLHRGELEFPGVSMAGNRCVARTTAWLTLAAMLMLPLSTAQSKYDAPAFDVASIKPIEMSDRFVGHVGLRIDTLHGIFGCDYCNVQFLVEWAYDLKAYQVSAPSWPWLRSTTYQIDARMPVGATGGQLQMMMQRLLAERFGLKVHRGEKELPVFAMMAGPTKPKLQPAKGPSTASFGGNYLISHRTTLGGLANNLSSKLSRPVLDQTEIDGTYDIDLHWDSGDSMQREVEIQRAIQDQLGLILKPSKAKITVLVIDALEKTPTPN